MNEDDTLLRHFVENHTEDAFTELVQRHLAMVYATALRRVGGDAHLAQDATQSVFISLARKASTLRSHASLAGWLYISTHRATAEVVRREQRRKQREASAHSMHLTNTPEDRPVDPASLRPLLDDALVELKSEDREAVVLRFFAQRSFAEIGAALRITEEAARKRVNRALEKLQEALSRRGITSTATALGGALSAVGITAAPAPLVSQVAAVALAESMALPTASLTAAFTSSLLPAAALAAVLTGLSTITPQQRVNAALAGEIARLERAPAATAGLQSEIADLTRALAHARTPSTQTPALAALPSAVTQELASDAKEVLITTEGSLQWEGEPVTLDEFLSRLVKYHSAANRSGSQLIVKGNGVTFGQLNYVLEEARKAGITSLVVESDSRPDSERSTTWF